MAGHIPVNFNQITDTFWLGSNMCCSLHNETLLKLGFEADIDLEEARPEAPPRTKIYLWLPTPDHQAPSQDQLRLGVAAATELARRQIKTYLHCKNGHGRAPTLMTAYLMATGKTLDEAFNFIKARRPVVHLNDIQRSALEQFAATLQ